MTTNITLHRAGLPSAAVVRGADQVTEELQVSFSQLGNQTDLLCSTTHTAKRATFSLFLHQEATLPAVGGGAAAGAPIDAVSIWVALWTAVGNGFKVSELICMVATKPICKDQTAASSKFAFNANHFKRTNDTSADTSKLVEVATAFINLYDHPEGAAEKVPSLLADNFIQWEPMKDAVKEGSKQVQENLKMHAQYWETEYAWCMVAPVDGSTGFTLWVNQGHMKDPDNPFECSKTPVGRSTYFGSEFVTLNADGLVQTTLHMSAAEPKTDADMFDFIKVDQAAKQSPTAY